MKKKPLPHFNFGAYNAIVYRSIHDGKEYTVRITGEGEEHFERLVADNGTDAAVTAYHRFIAGKGVEERLNRIKAAESYQD